MLCHVSEKEGKKEKERKKKKKKKKKKKNSNSPFRCVAFFHVSHKHILPLHVAAEKKKEAVGELLSLFGGVWEMLSGSYFFVKRGKDIF